MFYFIEQSKIIETPCLSLGAFSDVRDDLVSTDLTWTGNHTCKPNSRSSGSTVLYFQRAKNLFIALSFTDSTEVKRSRIECNWFLIYYIYYTMCVWKKKLRSLLVQTSCRESSQAPATVSHKATFNHALMASLWRAAPPWMARTPGIADKLNLREHAGR